MGSGGVGVVWWVGRRVWIDGEGRGKRKGKSVFFEVFYAIV